MLLTGTLKGLLKELEYFEVPFFKAEKNVIENYRALWNETFLKDQDDSGDESSAKGLFKQPTTTLV